jgi:16S rRNA (guanine527-N7)-methyltransferase
MDLEISNVEKSICLSGIKLETERVQKLVDFYTLLLDWNKTHNLTGPLNYQVLMQRHCIECLLIKPYLLGNTIADIGSGAGLPGIPLAIAYPEFSFSLVESRQKRIQFISYAKDHLELSNVTIMHARIESIDLNICGFNTVMARAVAPIDRLMPMLSSWIDGGTRLIVPCQKNINLQELLERFSCYKIEKVDFPEKTNTKSGLLIIEKSTHE